MIWQVWSDTWSGQKSSRSTLSGVATVQASRAWFCALCPPKAGSRMRREILPNERPVKFHCAAEIGGGQPFIGTMRDAERAWAEGRQGRNPKLAQVRRIRSSAQHAKSRFIVNDCAPR